MFDKRGCPIRAHRTKVGGIDLVKDKPIAKPDFTTSADTSSLTPEQKQQLEEMVQFLQTELKK